MKKIIIYTSALFCFFSCSKEKINNEQLQVDEGKVYVSFNAVIRFWSPFSGTFRFENSAIFDEKRNRIGDVIFYDSAKSLQALSCSESLKIRSFELNKGKHSLFFVSENQAEQFIQAASYVKPIRFDFELKKEDGECQIFDIKINRETYKDYLFIQVD